MRWARKIRSKIGSLRRATTSELLACGPAAVDDEGGAGAEAGLVGGQEQDGLGDLVRLAPACHGVQVLDTLGLLGVLEVALGQGRADDARPDRVDADAPLTELH